MQLYILIPLIAIGAVIVIMIIGIIVTKIIKTSQSGKMYQAVEGVLKHYAINNDALVETHMKPEYDYTLKTKNKIIYIKVLHNSGSNEITVNNSVKWQLRKSFNDDTMRFVEGIEPLMRMDIKKEHGLTPKKLYIVYPNARSLLKYINECEMEFIYPATDVYGTNVITFADLREHNDLLDLKEVKKKKDKEEEFLRTLF